MAFSILKRNVNRNMFQTARMFHSNIPKLQKKTVEQDDGSSDAAAFEGESGSFSLSTLVHSTLNSLNNGLLPDVYVDVATSGSVTGLGLMVLSNRIRDFRKWTTSQIPYCLSNNPDQTEYQFNVKWVKTDDIRVTVTCDSTLVVKFGHPDITYTVNLPPASYDLDNTSVLHDPESGLLFVILKKFNMTRGI